MTGDLSGKYYVRKGDSDAWEDVTTKFTGVNILKVDGFNELGEAVNVYDEQWVNSTVEDVMVTTQVNNADFIIRKNGDLSVTFIAGERYGALDTQTVHDTFIEYMCGHGAVWFKSAYTNKQVKCICTKGYKATVERLRRGNRSFIMGTIELHCIQPPTTVPAS